MEKFFERNYIRGYHVYKKVWAATVGEALCAQKLFRSIRCSCEKRRNYHRTFTSKPVAGVFAVFATGKYTVASVSASTWNGAEYNTHSNYSL